MQLREIVFWVLPYPSLQAPALLSTVYSGTPGRAQKVLRHVALREAPTIVDNDWTNFLKDCFVVSCLFVQIRASLLAIASSEAPLCPMSGWVCQWKPFWIPVEDSFKKAYMEEWVFIRDVPSEGPSSAEDLMSIAQITVN